jgi:hypothetical protein
MYSVPHFSMPSVHVRRADHPARGGSERHPAVSDSRRPQVRVAVGGRVIDRELTDRELAADALPEAIDF